MGDIAGQFQRLAERGELGVAGDASFDGGEGGAEHVIEVVGEFLGFADRVGGNHGSSARVRFVDVNRIAAT